MAKGIIIESVKDALAAGSNIIESAEKEVVWLLEPAILALAFQFGIPNKSNVLLEKGGRVRGITKISRSSLDVARKLLDNGQDLRHIDQYQGAFMLVADKKESISSINVNTVDVSLDDPLVAFWTDDQSYAEFLIATFEAAWSEGVDAEKRLREL
jgi:hypothetical protein